HAFVDSSSGSREERAALLQVEQRVRRRLAHAIGYERAGRAATHRSLPYPPTKKHRVQQSCALRLRQKLVAKSDQPARWRFELQTHAAGAVIDHLRHLPFATAESFSDDADELVWTVDDHGLDRFERLAVDSSRDCLGLRDLELITFATHHFDQYRQLQFTAPGYFELIGRVSFFNADRHVAENLFVESFLDLPRRHKSPLASRERLVVDAEDHRDGRFVDSDRGQRMRVVDGSDRVADVDVLDAGECNDLAEACALDRFSLQSLEDVKLRHLRLENRSIGFDDSDLIADLDLAGKDPADCEATYVIVVVEIGDEELQ